MMEVADTSETTTNIHGVRCNKTANFTLSTIRKSNLPERFCIVTFPTSVCHITTVPSCLLHAAHNFTTRYTNPATISHLPNPQYHYRF